MECTPEIVISQMGLLRVLVRDTAGVDATSGCTAASSSSSSSSSLWSSANEMGRVVDTVLIVRGKAAGMVPFLEILS